MQDPACGKLADRPESSRVLELRQRGPVSGAWPAGHRGLSGQWECRLSRRCVGYVGSFRRFVHERSAHFHVQLLYLKKKKRHTCSRCFSHLHRPHKLTHSPFLLPRATCPSSWGGNPLRASVNAAPPPPSKAEHLFILSLHPRTHIHAPPLSANHCDTGNLQSN